MTIYSIFCSSEINTDITATALLRRVTLISVMMQTVVSFFKLPLSKNTWHLMAFVQEFERLLRKFFRYTELLLPTSVETEPSLKVLLRNTNPKLGEVSDA
ncbi:UNVERIFIED_CONTAM: hypothetical protein K2H54_030788 [Gekko kuhli]